jgi:hypothetical protein
MSKKVQTLFFGNLHEKLTKYEIMVSLLLQTKSSAHFLLNLWGWAGEAEDIKSTDASLISRLRFA